MTTRINFQAWGHNDYVEVPAYAMMTDADNTPAEAVARAIASKSGLDVVTFRPDVLQIDGGRVSAHHYEMTLGSPIPQREGGGWIPRSRCWISLDADAS